MKIKLDCVDFILPENYEFVCFEKGLPIVILGVPFDLLKGGNLWTRHLICLPCGWALQKPGDISRLKLRRKNCTPQGTFKRQENNFGSGKRLHYSNIAYHFDVLPVIQSLFDHHFDANIVHKKEESPQTAMFFQTAGEQLVVEMTI